MTDYSYLKTIHVTGPISATVVPEGTGEPGFKGYFFMLVGSTGSGKSTFIEALVANRQMGISKNQLEGYTQNIVAYELMNIRTGYGSCLKIVDTPGFGDTQISEAEIVTKINEWMKVNDVPAIHHILYFSPIHVPRLPGSQRKTIKMLQSLTRNDGSSSEPGSITIITTMWDHLWKESQISHAEARFSELENNIWKDVVNRGGSIHKFNNTQESSLSIIDTVYRITRYFSYNPERNNGYSTSVYQRHLYLDLLERVDQSRQNAAQLLLELQSSANTNDSESDVVQLLTEDLQRNEDLLRKFETQLANFSNPPLDLKDNEITLQSRLHELSNLPFFIDPSVDIRDDSVDQHFTPCESTASITHHANPSASPNIFTVAHIDTQPTSAFKTTMQLDGTHIPPSPVDILAEAKSPCQAPPEIDDRSKSPMSARCIQHRFGVFKALFVKAKLRLVELIRFRRRR